MGKTELVLDANELHRLSIECASCKTLSTFDMSQDFNRREIVCARCAGRIEGAEDMLRAYREFYRSINPGKFNVQFRLDMPQE